MAQLVPFADDATSLSVGDLAVENGSTRVAISGALDLTRDKAGLARAEALKAVVDAVVEALRAVSDLPEAVPAEVARHGTRRNPFA